MSSLAQSTPFSIQEGSESKKTMICDIMSEHLPNFAIAFNKDTLKYSFMARLFERIHEEGKNNWVSAEKMLLIVQGASYGIQNGKGQTRTQFNSGVGLEASKFRKSVMKQAVHNAQKDTHGLFVIPADKGTDDGKNTEKSSKMSNNKSSRTKVVAKKEKYDHPDWLKGSTKSGFIRISDIDNARDIHEKVNGNKYSKIMNHIAEGKAPSTEEVALFAMKNFTPRSLTLRRTPGGIFRINYSKA